jgi:hypothetical protein
MRQTPVEDRRSEALFHRFAASWYFPSDSSAATSLDFPHWAARSLRKSAHSGKPIGTDSPTPTNGANGIGGAHDRKVR